MLRKPDEARFVSRARRAHQHLPHAIFTLHYDRRRADKGRERWTAMDTMVLCFGSGASFPSSCSFVCAAIGPAFAGGGTINDGLHN